MLTVSVPADYEYRESPIFARLDGKPFRALRITPSGSIFGHVKGERCPQALRPNWLLGTLRHRELLGLPLLRDGVL